MFLAKSPPAAASVLVLPNDLIAEIISAENRIQQQLEVVAGGGVAVKVEAAGVLQHGTAGEQAGGHVDEVGAQAGLFAHGEGYEVDEGVEGLAQGGIVGGDEGQGLALFAGPFPGVVEDGGLGRALGIAIVVTFGVKGRGRGR